MMRQSADLQIWRRDDDDAHATTVRMRGTLQAPIAQVMAILWDNDSRCEWVQGCKESRTLERHGKFQTLQYSRNESGPLLPDRDVILQNDLSLDPNVGVATLKFHNVQDPSRPPGMFIIRMPRVEGIFVLKQVDASHTEVTYEATTDAGGGVLSFMARAPIIEKVKDLMNSLRQRILHRGPGAAAALRQELDLSGFAASPQ